MFPSNSSIHAFATRWAFLHFPPVIFSLKTPNVFGPPSLKG